MGSSGPSNHHGVRGRSWSVRSDTSLPHPILQAPSHSSSVPPPGFLHPRRPQMTRFEGGEDALPRHSRPSAAGCCGDRWGCGERQPQRPHPGQRLAGRVPPAQANSTVAIHPVLTAVLKKLLLPVLSLADRSHPDEGWGGERILWHTPIMLPLHLYDRAY